MSTSVLKIDVNYSQLAVFLSTLQAPFNDWTQKHVNQGFSWRPGSVSFRTLVESGLHNVEIVLTQQPIPILANAIRVIAVPFDVPHGTSVEISGISNAVSISLPVGQYSLRCEFLPSCEKEASQVRVVFYKNIGADFKIIKADPGLLLDDELLTNAEPSVSGE